MEHLINLNFAPGGLPATVHVSQYDDTIRQLRFQLWFGRSKVEVPSGASVRVDIKKPDGHIVLVNGTVNSSDRSIVTVPTTKQMTAAPGGARGTLVVSSTGDKRISSAIFILQVHRDPVEDGDASDSDLSMLQDAIDQTAANASAAQAAATAAQQAASSFTTDTTLSVSGKAADAKKTGDELTAIKADLADNNVINFTKGTDGTSNGVTYTNNGDGTWTVNGTSTSASFRTLISGLDGWTNGLKAGETYCVRYATTDNNIQLRIYPYVNGTLVNEPVIFNDDGEYTIPAEASGIGVRLFVANGKTISNATCAIKFLNAPSNKDLANKFAQKIPYQNKIAFFGDSIMWGRDGNGSASTRVTDTIPAIVEKRLGVACDNYGVGGMGYLRPADSTNEIAYDKIAGTDITEYDVIVLCFGVNDGFKTVGTWDSTDETTCLGQFNKIINYIYTQNPTATIVVFAPYNGTNAGAYPDYWYGTPGGAATSRQILSDALRKACEFYWIPYIEQKDSPISAKTITTALPDGVHPSAEYYHRLGDWFCGKLIQPGGGSVTVDSALSSTSTNPVQNKIIKQALDSKADLDDLGDTENGIKIITGNNILHFVDGYYINTSGATADVTNLVANSSFRVAVMECESGDKFRITAKGSTAAKTWAFIASNGNVISAVTHNSALDNHLLTAPDNSAYIVVNDMNTGGICYYGNALLVSRVTDLENYRVNKNIDLINISRERPLSSGQYYTLQTAIEEVYTYYQKARHGGTIVVFNDTYSTTRAYQYIYNDTIAAATNFKDPTKWILINTTTKQAIVVAAYDSTDEAKRNADFVGTGENNGIDIINTAIQTLGGGGRVYLRNGTYKSTYGVNILYDNIVLEGESLGVIIQRDGTNAIFSQATRTGIIMSNLTVNNPISFASGSKVYTHDCFIQNLYTDSHYHELNIVYVTPEQGIEGINAAIDSMTTGGKIVLSSGTYTNVVSGSTAAVRFINMTAKNNITIEGQGYTTVISRSTGTNDVLGTGSGVSNNIIQNLRIAHTITRPNAPDGIKAVRLVGCWINTDYVNESQEQVINICNVGKGRYFETLFDALQSFYAGRAKFNISDRWEINIYGHIVETKQVSINRDYINFRGHNALVEFRGNKGVHLNVVNETSPYDYGDHEICVEIRDIHFLKTGCYNYYDEPCVNVEKDNVRFYNCVFENASSSPSPFNQETATPTTDTQTGSRRHGIEVKCTKYGDECRTEFHGCVGIGSPYGFQNTRGWYLIFGAPKLFDCIGIGGGIGEYGHGILNHRSSKAILVGCVGYAGPKNYRQSAGIRFQASGSSDLTSCIGYGGCGEQFKSNGVSAARVTEICTALGIDSSTYVVNGVVQYDQLTNPNPVVHKESDDICAQFTNDDVQIVALGSGTEEGYGISFWAHDGSPKLIDCQGYMGSGENSHGIHAIAYTNPTIIGGYYGVQDILQNLEIVTGANNEAVLTPTSGLNDYTSYAITGMSLTFIGGAAASGSTITVETDETTPTVLVDDFQITGQSSILHIPVTETVVSAGVGLRVWIKVNGTKIAVTANRFLLLVQYHYANTGASAVYIGSNATPHIYKAIIKAHGANEAIEVESGRTASIDMYDCAIHGTVDASVTFTPKTAINGSSNYVI